jgi:flagellar FliJ protein
MAEPRPFQYETLLRIRKRQEDLRAMALAVARRDLHAARQQRAEITQEQQWILDAAGAAARERFDPSEVRRYYQYERHLARLRDAKDAEIQELTSVVELKRSELEEATRQKRVVEKLKERRTAAYIKYLRKVEQRALDEAATNYAALERNSLAGRGAQKKE